MPEIAGIDVSRETIARIEEFQALVLKWTKKINLIAPSTATDVWQRHIVDSAQLYRHVDHDYKLWVDIGSGGGFPGIVLACLAKELRPDATFVLIESDQRKSTFLRTAARELALPVTAISKRIEEAPAQNADVISARALGSLDQLLHFSAPHLKSDGICAFQKGRTHQTEIVAARANWQFELEAHQSITDSEAAILILKDIARD